MIMPLALILCSAGLYCFSFPDLLFLQGVPLLSGGCALPFLFALEGRRAPTRFLLGLVWGLVANGLVTAWLIPVSVGGWGAFTCALAWQGGVFGLLFPSRLSMRALVLIPSAWVFSEFIRALALGGFTWSIGYALAPVPALIQPAAFGGVYALAAAVLGVNTIIFLRLKGILKTRGFVFLAVALGMLVCVPGAWMMMSSGRQGPPEARVAAVQANISPEQKLRDELYDVNAGRHVALTQRGAVEGRLGPQDLVVWPETAFVDDVLSDARWRGRLEALARGLQVNMLVGSALLVEGKDLNSAVFLGFDGRWGPVYNKRHLVPFTEFTPAGAERVAASMGIGKYHFTAGQGPGAMPLPDGKVFRVAICSEEFYPGLFRPAAAFSVVMLNDGWFTLPQALWLHALAAPLRAVESGASLVRVANTGVTAAFDAHGRRTGEALGPGRPGVAVYDVSPAGMRTFYAKWGDVFAMMCGLFVIMERSIRLARRPRPRIPRDG